MTDHEHEWTWWRPRPDEDYRWACNIKECPVELPIEQAEAMLNEHAKLKRENELIFKLLLPDTALWLRSKLDALADTQESE